MAALGGAVLIIAVIALQHPGNRSATSGTVTHTVTTPASSPATTPRRTPTTSPTSTPTSIPTPTPTPTPVPGRLPLVVLNNTSATGLADAAATTFRAGGWTVTSTGNISNDILSTCAYYDPNSSGAQAAATALRAQFPAIKRVAPKFTGLPAGPVVVVLTSDYTSG